MIDEYKYTVGVTTLYFYHDKDRCDTITLPFEVDKKYKEDEYAMDED